MSMKILTLDIETAPHAAWVWGLWDQNVGLNQIAKPGEILCFAAKWYGDPKVHFYSVHKHGKKAMLEAAHKLLDEADVVVGWNSKKFDVPWLMGQFAVNGLTAPSPIKHVDLMETSKRKLKLASNKLEYVASQLDVPQKISTGGFELWKQCMAGDPKAWRKMRAYNIGDVMTTEAVYDKLKSFIGSHPNHGTYSNSTVSVCPTCGSEDIHERGWAYTQVNKYRRMHCRGCGSWSKGGYTEFTTEDRRKILRNIGAV